MRVTPILAVFLVALGAGAGSADGASYYVSLGDSLAAGTQAQGVVTRKGYTDALYKLERKRFPRLQILKLGCPGETAATFVAGGKCTYRGGAARGTSQLHAATRFMRANRAQLGFVTLSLGFDAASVADARRNLPRIARELRRAAGRKVPIAILEPYDAALAGPYAIPGAGPVAELNAVIASVAARQRLRTVDAYAALRTREVICKYTFTCQPGPKGPDGHLNTAGYRVVAGLFRAVLAKS